jgi:plastocyanin
MTAISGSRVFVSFTFALAILLASSSRVMSQDKNDDSPVVIRMTDEMKFVPNQVTIRVGQTVKWTNEGDAGGASHSVTTNPDRLMDPKHVSIPAGAAPFDSGIVNPGKSFMYTFKVPGVYKYSCAPHEGMMRAEITVEP